MSALGDSLYIICVLVPFITLLIRNYLANLLGLFMGTIGFLVFVQDLTGITFSASTFYLALLPLALALLNFGMFFNWLKEERI